MKTLNHRIFTFVLIAGISSGVFAESKGGQRVTEPLITSQLGSSQLESSQLESSQLKTGQLDIKSLGVKWSEANYELAGDTQELAFENLIKQAEEYVSNNENDAQGFIWRGIIKSSFAGVKGGLDALSLAKEAKSDFSQAILIDENALSGSAHASLGLLYAKVPGWPFGFGSDKKAEEHLLKALQINPNGVDANYFYGEFLYNEKRKYKTAKKFLIKAQSADPVRITLIADEKRQQEIAEVLLMVEKRLKSKRG